MPGPDGRPAIFLLSRFWRSCGVDGAEMTIDWIEVSRVAHQVGTDHGRNGYRFAERLAIEANAESRLDDRDFWEAVAAALRPRGVVPGS